ncbi:MAG TPA: hypothetical protein DCG19_13160 [Cryomorphaceae bacterium]|nr:hypothetical protein [Owenweeksia sp.]MBG00309.1 hypothetical protein [Owenweeksia sp.]HAD98352.1 hypothetical protein [Cryomorphaceae bacterium]HBF18961.1 hypothetical protein [Cryomorphaceae bacterium]HCQ16266.1 hypothetical protein [Cryomorphaceae bacterium]|tara:strand:+ start:339 stop:575 length:237 start_codon:yes stop_codon:yes gene_type:complete
MAMERLPGKNENTLSSEGNHYFRLVSGKYLYPKTNEWNKVASNLTTDKGNIRKRRVKRHGHVAGMKLKNNLPKNSEEL